MFMTKILIILAIQPVMKPALLRALERCPPLHGSIKKLRACVEKLLAVAAVVIVGLTKTNPLDVKKRMKFDFDTHIQQLDQREF